MSVGDGGNVQTQNAQSIKEYRLSLVHELELGVHHSLTAKSTLNVLLRLP